LTRDKLVTTIALLLGFTLYTGWQANNRLYDRNKIWL